MKEGYSYNDISVVPAVISDIKSRSECNPYYSDENLPIFASCMSTVVDDKNYVDFEHNHIIPVIPRNIDIMKRADLMINDKWVAFSLTEFKAIFIDNSSKREPGSTYKVCVDIANGHMRYLYDLCLEAKKLANKNNYKLIIMTGNIANPETYRWICNFNDENNIKAVDYIRVSIGSGSQCTTSSNVSIHYPLASLIKECYKIKKFLDNYTSKDIVPNIIADGGIRNYSDVIKALALGADYVMIGGLFAGMYESASPLLYDADFSYNGEYNGDTEEPDDDIDSVFGGFYKGHCLFNDHAITEEEKRENIKFYTLFKECYGMSTKQAQALIGKSNKTAEGKHSMVPVKYTLYQWSDNMKDFLKSAMSYCNARTLNEFIGKQELIINSPAEIAAVNK